MTTKQEMKKLLDKLYNAKREGALYAMKDIADWMEYDLDSLSLLVDELPDGYNELELAADYEVKGAIAS